MKKTFTAKRIALDGAFTALAFVVSLLEFPIFSGTPASFLKLDFGNVFLLLLAFMTGPVDGAIACVVKESLRITVSSTGGIGELANAVITCSFLLIPSVSYLFHRTKKTVLITLPIACVAQTGIALVFNRFVLFSVYGVADVPAFFAVTYPYLIAFNLIKTAVISVLTFLLYKRLAVFFKTSEDEKKKETP